MDKSSKAYSITKSVLAVLALVALAIISMELIARLAIFTADDILNIGATEARAHQPAFDHVDYDSVKLYREQEASDGKLYSPYVIWKHKPHNGELLNVDDESNRVTEFNSDDDDAIEIWMFGGSALFGIGAPDGQTIPSHLAKQMNLEPGIDVLVRNFGQEGYVSTQEVVALIRELQTRPRPDLVIFYDGFNDAISILKWEEIPGSHFQPYRTGERLEATFAPAVRTMATYRILERLTGINVGVVPIRDFPKSSEEAGKQAANIWLQNEAVVAALAEEYGFRHLFIFQPILGFPIGNAMRDRVRTSQSEEPDADIHDLSDLLRKSTHPVFIDSVHITGVGNESVAAELFSILQKESCRKTPSRVSQSSSSKLEALCQ